MNSLPLQRRLDGLSRDLEAVREALTAVAARIDAGAPGAPATPDAIARVLLDTRRARREALGANLFSDPAWDMLLALFAAAERGEALSVSQLCAASSVAQTTALRWVDSLEAAGLVSRGLDPADARRTLLALSPTAREKIRLHLHRTVAALTGRTLSAG
jgi:DNA-binding MarR family transcriptional regulator